MPIHGINHVTIIVHDMDRTVQLFVQALGAREEYRSPEREYSKYPETFLRIGDLWLVVMEDAHIQRARSYDHIALSIDLEAVPEITRRLIEAGAEVVPSRPRVGAESASVYFYDFDNHLFELHAGNIADRLRHYSAARQGV
nr:VOC family protein [Pseudoxanthomonas sp.]